MSKLWFKTNKDGYFWLPATWQGWTVTTVYAFFLVGWFWGQYQLSSHAGEILLGYIPRFIFLTGVFGFIAYKTGERLSWRWVR